MESDISTKLYRVIVLQGWKQDTTRLNKRIESTLRVLTQTVVGYIGGGLFINRRSN